MFIFNDTVHSVVWSASHTMKRCSTHKPDMLRQHNGVEGGAPT